MRMSSDWVSVFQLTVEKLLSPPGNHDGSNHADGQHKRTHSRLLRIISENSSICDGVSGANDVTPDCRG